MAWLFKDIMVVDRVKVTVTVKVKACRTVAGMAGGILFSGKERLTDKR
jgi:hypothetical protein